MSSEILKAGDGYITVFPSYNKVADGMYLKDWQEVIKKLDAPIRLDITRSDYTKLDSKTQLAIKFKYGGYDAGACPIVRTVDSKGKVSEKPSREKGVPRPSTYNVIVLDADGVKDANGNKVGVSPDFDSKLLEVLKEFTYYAHATISSTATAKRRRILIPVAVPVTADVREAVIRYLADRVGMDNIDPASKNNKQMMCLPVHLRDGDDYHFYNDTGKLFSALDWLPAGWESVENWPKWSNESEIKIQKQSKREKKYLTETGQWTPVPDKNRLHDAFNKTYRVSDILAESGKYVKTSDRWSHTYDDARDGIKVTNDAILYSYYGSDILSVGRDLDAFEVALILRHGSLEDKKAWADMYRETGADPAVSKTMINSLGVELPESAESWRYMYDSTEEGLASRCMELYHHKIKNKKWYRYENGIYRECDDDAMLTDALRIVRVASALQPDDDALRDMIGKVNTARNILKAWRAMASEKELPTEEWENHPWYLHFTDGVLDLRAFCEGTGEYLLPHSPDYLLTQTTGYAFANVQNVEPKVLDEVISAMETYLPDEKLRRYFQRAMGRSLTAVSCFEDKCVWLLSSGTGKDGGNGKSTVLLGIRGALNGGTNGYYYSLPGSYLYYNSRERDSEAPSPLLAGMAYKRFVNFTEYDGLRTLNSEKYKNYTSAGPVTARKMQSNGDNFDARCVCVIDCNGMPGLQRKENAILRRTRVVPFDAKLKADARIKARWETDKRIHYAVMYWLLLGLKDWYDNNMSLDGDIKEDKTIPSQVYDCVMDWYESFDDPSLFFEEHYVISNNNDDFLVFEECFREYNEQVFMRGVTDYVFRQMECRWLREHGITTKRKMTIPTTGTRRMCFVGVYLVKSSVKRALSHVEVVKEDIKDNSNNMKVEQVDVFDDTDFKAV